MLHTIYIHTYLCEQYVRKSLVQFAQPINTPFIRQYVGMIISPLQNAPNWKAKEKTTLNHEHINIMLRHQIIKNQLKNINIKNDIDNKTMKT